MRPHGGGGVIQPMLDGENGVLSATPECDAGTASLEASSKVRDAGGDEGSTFERLAEREGDSAKLVLLVGGDCSRSRRSSRPRLVAMSKNSPSIR